MFRCATAQPHSWISSASHRVHGRFAGLPPNTRHCANKHYRQSQRHCMPTTETSPPPHANLASPVPRFTRKCAVCLSSKPSRYRSGKPRSMSLSPAAPGSRRHTPQSPEIRARSLRRKRASVGYTCRARHVLASLSVSPQLSFGYWTSRGFFPIVRLYYPLE